MGRSGSAGSGFGEGVELSPPDICGYIETTLIDWEGSVAAEVFLCGCNFRCPFCHSAHLVFGRVERLMWEAVVDSLRRRSAFIDGVVVSGGEPTLHGERLVELCRRIKAEGFAVKIDTNGTSPHLLRRLYDEGLLDFVAVDFKAPLDEQRYRVAAGVHADIAAIKQTLTWLISGQGPAYEVRTTVVPTLHDITTLEEMAHTLSGVADWVLQNFNPKNGCLDPQWEKITPYEREVLEGWVERLRRIVPCRLRGAF
ncbi:MAG: anaerobic ribonucleoside-triphosphate reductase activating protein [Planctomycetota bacterium]|nr:MAG: anaerobic ribonucleoside-triphosphate reductase activating protein [Planctomycetota bacterium]